MLHTSQTTRFFILCTTLAIATPILPGMEPIAPNPAVETDQQVKERATLFEKLLKIFDQALIKVKNNLSLAIQFTKKYGRNIDKDAITKKMFEANDALDRFVQMKIRSIQQYFQQDPTTIPAEGYQEIYETIDSVVRAATRLVQELDAYIQSNFSEEFNFDFLISKNNLSLTEENVAPEMILTRCIELDTAAENLFESSNAIGLTLWNKTARKIDKYLLRPIVKYHVLPIVGTTMLATSFVLYHYWRAFGKNHLLKPQKSGQDQADASTKHFEDTQEHQIPSSVSAADMKEAMRQNQSNKTPSEPNGFLKFLKGLAEKVGLNKPILEMLGDVPASTNDGSWSLNDSHVNANKTYWNRFMCTAHNILYTQDPIAAFFLTTCGTWLWSNKISPHILPALKSKIQLWWQHSLGGRHLEMQQQGSFECGIEWTFDQVIGLEHIKARFEPALAYAEDPVKHATIGAHVATNYIFYGVKRTGKSFFAVALAGEMKKRNPNMRILKIPSQIFHALGVKEAIDLIRSYAPCVVFIDEIDIAGFNRALDRNTTGELLKELGSGNISPSPDRPVFLLFATNKLESIDTSLTSMGRFGPSILFGTPLFIDRVQFVDAILRTNGHNSDNFDVYRLAERTEGNSFEDIKYCISEAILRAGTYNIPLTTELIMNVMDEILNGIYPEFPIELNPAALKVIATHYAGKALVSALMPSHELLDTVTIRKRKLPLMEEDWAGLSGKPTHQKKYEYGMLITRQSTSVGGGNTGERMLMTPELQKSYYMRIFAGSVAEEVILGMANNTCDELQIAHAYQNLICQCSDGGMVYYLKQQMSNEQLGEYFAKARDMVEGYKREIRELLTKHRRALDVLARALMSPALGGSITDGIVSMIIENPEGVNEQLDAVEAEMKKQQEERMKKQQEEYDRMMNERMDTVDVVPAENAQPDVVDAVSDMAARAEHIMKEVA